MTKEEIQKKLTDLSQQYAQVCSRIGDLVFKSSMMLKRADEEKDIAKGLEQQAAELNAKLQSLDAAPPKTQKPEGE